DHLFIPVKNAKNECWDFFQVKNNLLAAVQNQLLKFDKAFNFKKYTADTSYCFGWTKKFPDIIFLGLVSKGLGSFRMTGGSARGKNEIEFIYNGIFKGIDVSIRKIVADAKGDLWLTSSLNGIFHVRFEGDRIENYRVTHYTTAQGLPENDWNFVHFFNNRLLIATQKGLYEGVPAPGTAKDEYLFVPEKTIGQVIPDEYRKLGEITIDEKGTIWVISESGIGTIDKNPDGSYRWNSIPFKKIPHDVEVVFPDEQGIYWMTSPRGLYRFDSTMPKDYRTPFNALIRKVTKGRDAVIFNGTYSGKHSRAGELFRISSLRQPQAMIPNVEYKDNSLNFEFSAAFYEHEHENRFKYILEGFDKDWSEWTTQHKKEYTNLAEGKYRFRVRARNIYEQQSGEAIFAFSVSPPWYRTIPAYIAWGLLMGGFMTGFVKLYLLRREAEKNLRESEEKFRVLAEKSVVGICILQDNAVKYANPRLHEIFQYAPGQMEEKNLLDAVKEEDRSLVTLNLEIQAADPLLSEAFEFRGITATGDTIHLEGRGTQTQYKGKSAFLETLIDITDRKKAEEELMQSKKLETIGILSGGIAHDFNNLLTIIMGNISLVKDSIDQTSERLGKYVMPMEQAAFQATDLVKNFMTLAAGGWIEFEKISLTDILKNIGDEAPQIKEIPYTLSIPWDLKPLHGDERKLRRVMGNLLINGYEAHTHETPTGLSNNKPVSITIKAQNINLDKNNPWNLSEGQYVKISVIDAGKGIPPYHMNKIFDPYFSTKQKGTRKGLGMGLAICNAIVKKHNGHISVSSEVDKGTVVDLFLPAGGSQTSNELPGGATEGYWPPGT
ncbi:MAG TPA: ATP-binding protein, partial [Candidatus Deferrimicrobium sp.]|nr:ATP-binding protein [Candidatus Deferrimicrobium sp.]